MNLQFKLKLIRFVSKKLLKMGVRTLISNNSKLIPIIFKIADFIIKKTNLENEIFEIQGFKIKKGRTTRQLILTGEFHEPSIISIIEKEVKNGMKVFDLGANIGWVTLVFSKLVGGTGHVYSFEPDPHTFKILKENIELNKLKNVSVFQLGISNKKGVSKFSLIENQDGANRLESKTKVENCINVKTTTLDEFCREYNTKIDFLKMDIEGSEPKAFEGMKDVILNNPQIKIISEFHAPIMRDVGASPEKYLDDLERLGFIVNEFDEKKVGGLKSTSKEKLLKSNKSSFNIYCFRL